MVLFFAFFLLLAISALVLAIVNMCNTNHLQTRISQLESASNTNLDLHNHDILNVNQLETKTITTDNINTLTINGKLPYLPSTFNGACIGFSSTYTLGSIVSGSQTQAIPISIPSEYWTLGDVMITYNGPSGNAYFYGLGAGFMTDTMGTYDFSVWVNGVKDNGNLSSIYAGSTNSVITGEIQGSRIFTQGDYLQFSFDKGNDIPGNPVVQIFGSGFTLYRTG